MHIALLYYSDSHLMLQDPKKILGRGMVNLGFLKAILHTPQIQKVTLIVSSQLEADWCQETFGSLSRSAILNIISLSKLQLFLQQDPPHVLHILSPNLYRPLYIRNFLAKAPLAVTGVTHSLGHEPFLEYMHLNLMAKPQASDALICSSRTGQSVIRHGIELAQANLNSPNTLQTAIIPFAVDLNEIAKQKNTQFKKQLGWHEEDVVLLSLGRLSAYSKMDLLPLLLAYHHLPTSLKNKCKLIIAGATGQENYDQAIQQWSEKLGIQHSVKILANVDEAQKTLLLNNCDLFISLSDNYQETFGLSLVEAMAYGLPIIASDWNGYRDLIQDGKNGFLIPTQGLSQHAKLTALSPLQLDSINHLLHAQLIAIDHQVLTEKLSLLIESQALRQQMSAQCLQIVKKFSWPEVMNQYVSLWKNLYANYQATPTAAFTPMHYLKIFQDYPTHTLSPTQLYQLSNLGHDVKMGNFDLSLYPAQEEYYSTHCLIELINILDSAQSLQSLCKHFADQWNEESLAQHLQWLLKYGLIRRGNSSTKGGQV